MKKATIGRYLFQILYIAAVVQNGHQKPPEDVMPIDQQGGFHVNPEEQSTSSSFTEAFTVTSKVEDVFCQIEAGVLVTVSVPENTPGTPYIERNGGSSGCQAKLMGRKDGMIIYMFHLPKMASCGTIPARKDLFYNTIVVPANNLGIELGSEVKLPFFCRLDPPITNLIGSGVNLLPPKSNKTKTGAQNNQNNPSSAADDCIHLFVIIVVILGFILTIL